MGLPDGEANVFDMLAWAQEQTPFLRSPSARLVLLDLCIHAWRHDRNGEGADPGMVMRKHASLPAIQRTTGLSRRTVQRALTELQEDGYVLAELEPGNGWSDIAIFWTEDADAMREDVRRGIRTLPKGFQKPEKETPKVTREGNIIQFPLVSP